ncbi:MAG: archaellin/type IV pilin N-terminal domain-containing protein [Nanoarchaeota archaeon]|nr:hypothetical protein [Nanoarchaeota archaeon]MBU1445530.1 hypothetical protein [Nanoarchaeota archaeon]MBU2406360.1 hypothetical protein [Nanoarchaeota archaeon]MBU2420629.1 hypothetical protein [Nanoarchaeota archaeon]MBU2474923.1 hypothetical protein [Nanoarchaeota archaeon]
MRNIKLPALFIQEKKDLVFNKKGISPLIATVLLIAFVILIAILVWFWWDKIIRAEAEKVGVETVGAISCSQEISFSISNPTCHTGAINFDIENTNTGNIYKFKVRTKVGNNFLEVIELATPLQASEATQAGVNYNETLGAPDSIEVIPEVLSSGATITCNEQSQTAFITC